MNYLREGGGHYRRLVLLGKKNWQFHFHVADRQPCPGVLRKYNLFEVQPLGIEVVSANFRCWWGNRTLFLEHGY